VAGLVARSQNSSTHLNLTYCVKWSHWLKPRISSIMITFLHPWFIAALCAKHIHVLQRSDTVGNGFVCGLCVFSRYEEVYIGSPPTAPAPEWLEQPRNSFENRSCLTHMDSTLCSDLCQCVPIFRWCRFRNTSLALFTQLLSDIYLTAGCADVLVRFLTFIDRLLSLTSSYCSVT
jgi:hypothetical protein